MIYFFPIFLSAQLGPQTDVMTPQRIFLYNRQVLTGELGIPQCPRLSPQEIGTPEPESAPAFTSDVSAVLEKASSPLLRALPDFEKQFLRNLKRCADSNNNNCGCDSKVHSYCDNQ